MLFLLISEAMDTYTVDIETVTHIVNHVHCVYLGRELVLSEATVPHHTS